MQRSTTIFFLLALLISFTLFKVKYKVVEVEENLTQTLLQIQREEENVHILEAEWSHLNDPPRLQKLAEKYLEIGPVKTDQIVAVLGPLEKETMPEFVSSLAFMEGMEGMEGME